MFTSNTGDMYLEFSKNQVNFCEKYAYVKNNKEP